MTTGLPWVATNDDATLPLPWGQSPGNGAYIDLLAAAVRRRPDVVGKPRPPLYRLALDRLGTQPARTLAVGDRLDTDIVGAAAAGIDSAWVLTGVDRPTDLVVGQASPTYVLASLADLLEPYAVPTPDGGGWRCGAARATTAPTGCASSRVTPPPSRWCGRDWQRCWPGATAAPHRDWLRAGAETLERVLDDATRRPRLRCLHGPAAVERRCPTRPGTSGDPVA